MNINKETKVGTLTLNVDDWDVAFIVNDQEITTEEYTFEIDEFHPGITSIEKTIEVYNIWEADTKLKYEITEIYLYGEQIYLNQVEEGENTTNVPETIGTKMVTDGVTTANLFGNSSATIFTQGNTNYEFYLNYPTPFTITYSYEKDYLTGQEPDETAKTWMKINLEWNNDETNNDEDTRLGNMVYEFDNATDINGNLLNQGEPALKIIAKVTATRVIE